MFDSALYPPSCVYIRRCYPRMPPSFTCARSSAHSSTSTTVDMSSETSNPKTSSSMRLLIHSITPASTHPLNHSTMHLIHSHSIRSIYPSPTHPLIFRLRVHNSQIHIRTQEGHCKLIDFGFARSPNSDGLMKTQVGTPAYLSPEQLNGRTDDQ